MWRKILEYFADYPAQQNVARFLLENGLGISPNGKVQVNSIEISAVSIARVVHVDRRVVDATIAHINEIEELKNIFSNLRVTPDLSAVAADLGLSVFTIYPRNAGEKNIVSTVLSVFSAYDLSIRQIFVTDPYFVEKPKLVVIIDGEFPAQLITDLHKLPVVASLQF